MIERVPPAGVEPTSQVPQTCTLSIELWGHIAMGELNKEGNLF